MDLQKIMPDSYPFLYLGGGAGEGSSKKRKGSLDRLKVTRTLPQTRMMIPTTRRRSKKLPEPTPPTAFQRKGEESGIPNRWRTLGKISKISSI